MGDGVGDVAVGTECERDAVDVVSKGKVVSDSGSRPRESAEGVQIGWREPVVGRLNVFLRGRIKQSDTVAAVAQRHSRVIDKGEASGIDSRECTTSDVSDNNEEAVGSEGGVGRDGEEESVVSVPELQTTHVDGGGGGVVDFDKLIARFRRSVPVGVEVVGTGGGVSENLVEDEIIEDTGSAVVVLNAHIHIGRDQAIERCIVAGHREADGRTMQTFCIAVINGSDRDGL